MIDRCRFEKAGSTFQHFSKSYTLKNEYYIHLTSDATIISYKCPFIGKQVLYNRLP